MHKNRIKFADLLRKSALLYLPIALHAITSTSLMFIEFSGFGAVKFNTMAPVSGIPSIGKSGALTSVDSLGGRKT